MDCDRLFAVSTHSLLAPKLHILRFMIRQRSVLGNLKLSIVQTFTTCLTVFGTSSSQAAEHVKSEIPPALARNCRSSLVAASAIRATLPQTLSQEWLDSLVTVWNFHRRHHEIAAVGWLNLDDKTRSNILNYIKQEYEQTVARKNIHLDSPGSTDQKRIMDLILTYEILQKNAQIIDLGLQRLSAAEYFQTFFSLNLEHTGIQNPIQAKKLVALFKIIRNRFAFIEKTQNQRLIVRFGGSAVNGRGVFGVSDLDYLPNKGQVNLVRKVLHESPEILEALAASGVTEFSPGINGFSTSTHPLIVTIEPNGIHLTSGWLWYDAEGKILNEIILRLGRID